MKAVDRIHRRCAARCAAARLWAAALPGDASNGELASAEEQHRALDYARRRRTRSARAERFYEQSSRVPFVGTECAERSEGAPRRVAILAARLRCDRSRAGRTRSARCRRTTSSCSSSSRTPCSARLGSRPTMPRAWRRPSMPASPHSSPCCKNSVRNEDAAFNYEYLLRLRADRAR